MLRIAMLSKWHVHADGYANMVNNSGKAKVVAVWDDDVERGETWAKNLGCEFIPCLDTLLAREDIDAVVCDIPTTKHKDALIKAAKAGKHIFTEKALAPTVAECEEIAAAIRESGVTFTISYPQRGRGVVQFAKKMINDGAFGMVNYIRYRDAHNGVSGDWLPAYWYNTEDTGGGSMMDLGCHPMYLMAYLGGKVKRLNAIFNQPLKGGMDENAVATMEFENGAIGIAETSFISYTSPRMLEIYGTEGSLIAVGDNVQFTSTKLSGIVNGFIKPDLPAEKPAPLFQFIDACVNGTGTPKDLGLEDAIALTELLEQSYIANDNNKTVIF